MIRRSLASMFVVVALATLCFAADFNGRWEGKFPGPNGQEMALAFDFKVDGETLTGTVESQMGKVDISNGKVKDDEISFTVQVPNAEITHAGKLVDGTITLKVHGPWGDSELALKRPAAK
jgi:hypothetical protein